MTIRTVLARWRANGGLLVLSERRTSVLPTLAASSTGPAFRDPEDVTAPLATGLNEVLDPAGTRQGVL